MQLRITYKGMLLIQSKVQYNLGLWEILSPKYSFRVIQRPCSGIAELEEFLLLLPFFLVSSISLREKFFWWECYDVVTAEDCSSLPAMYVAWPPAAGLPWPRGVVSCCAQSGVTVGCPREQSHSLVPLIGLCRCLLDESVQLVGLSQNWPAEW